jgi:hypothetical protein
MCAGVVSGRRRCRSIRIRARIGRWRARAWLRSGSWRSRGTRRARGRTRRRGCWPRPWRNRPGRGGGSGAGRRPRGRSFRWWKARTRGGRRSGNPRSRRRRRHRRSRRAGRAPRSGRAPRTTPRWPAARRSRGGRSSAARLGRQGCNVLKCQACCGWNGGGFSAFAARVDPDCDKNRASLRNS